MAKYDFNFKMKVVKSYLDGEGGLGSIAKQYGIGSDTQVKICFYEHLCKYSI